MRDDDDDTPASLAMRRQTEEGSSDVLELLKGLARYDRERKQKANADAAQRAEL